MSNLLAMDSNDFMVLFAIHMQHIQSEQEWEAAHGA
jgi:hypothetical protein